MKFRVRKLTTATSTHIHMSDYVIRTMEQLMAGELLWISHCVSYKVSTYCNEGSLVGQTRWRSVGVSCRLHIMGPSVTWPEISRHGVTWRHVIQSCDQHKGVESLLDIQGFASAWLYSNEHMLSPLNAGKPSQVHVREKLAREECQGRLVTGWSRVQLGHVQ